jgi:hypothetical protein
MNAYDLLSDNSKVWIYQSNRPFTKGEVEKLRPILTKFADQWVSHNLQLKAFADVFNDQFVVLMVDETQAGASGCSIDSSVHFVKQIENAFKVNLFDRMTFTYQDDDKVITAPRDEFARLYQSGVINDDTLVFDTLVKTKKEFQESMVKPLGQSWHKRMV